MKLYMDILFLIVIIYFSYEFLQVLMKMRKEVIFPNTEEEIKAMRLHPEVKVDFPTYAKQKVGIMVNLIILLLVIVLFLLGVFLEVISWTFYPLMLLLLFNSQQYYKLFAIMDDGILCKSRFVSWDKMKSFQYIRIDKNHKFYGFSKEANDQYELRIKTKILYVSCVVITDEMNNKLNQILRERIGNEEK